MSDALVIEIAEITDRYLRETEMSILEVVGELEWVKYQLMRNGERMAKAAGKELYLGRRK